MGAQSLLEGLQEVRLVHHGEAVKGGKLLGPGPVHAEENQKALLLGEAQDLLQPGVLGDVGLELPGLGLKPVEPLPHPHQDVQLHGLPPGRVTW